MSHSRQKNQLAQENKTRKSKTQTCETLKHFAESGQKIFKTAFMKKNLSVFSKT